MSNLKKSRNRANKSWSLESCQPSCLFENDEESGRRDASLCVHACSLCISKLALFSFHPSSIGVTIRREKGDALWFILPDENLCLMEKVKIDCFDRPSLCTFSTNRAWLLICPKTLSLICLLQSVSILGFLVCVVAPNGLFFFILCPRQTYVTPSGANCASNWSIVCICSCSFLLMWY